MFILVKIVITTAIIVLVSEVARRSTLLGALIISIPTVSILSMTWLYVEKRDTAAVAQLATSTMWLVFPSLVLLIVLPLLLRRHVGFALSMTIACGATIACYFAMILALRQFGVKL